MTANLVSTENCTTLLQNRFPNTDVQFINLEIKPISENVEGMMGEHYYLFVTYKIDNVTNTEEFFLKVKPTKSEMQIEMVNECKAYKKEIFLYDTLIKEFNKYGYDTSFAAKSYLCVPENFLILDNLVKQNYVLSERQTVYDLNKIKCSLKALAKFHAAGFAYQETKSKEKSFNLGTEYAEYFEEVFFVFYTNPKHFCMTWWNSSITRLNKLIDLLPENETYKSEFKSMFNKFPYGKVFAEETKLPKTCGHGDLWSNNMLFKFENNVPVDCRLLDFQFCRYFYPCFDVLLVIFANTSASLRAVHLNELYEYYYTTLGETLDNYGCTVQNILPKEDFYESIRLTKVDALLHVTSALAVHYLPKEILTSALEKDKEQGEWLNELLMEDGNDLYCNAFTNDAKFCKILSDSLRDMRAALLERQQ